MNTETYEVEQKFTIDQENKIFIQYKYIKIKFNDVLISTTRSKINRKLFIIPGLSLNSFNINFEVIEKNIYKITCFCFAKHCKKINMKKSIFSF